MTERHRLALLIAATGALSFALMVTVARQAHDEPLEAATVYAVLAMLALAPLLALLWWRLERGILGPLARIGSDLSALVQSRKVDRPLELPRGHGLGPLSEPLAAMVEQLRGARAEIAAAEAAATARVAEQKRWLETILLDLSEGVVVCNAAHHILLYNQAAVRLLGRPEAVGLGRPLFSLVTREPVLHALELLDLRARSDDGGGGGGGGESGGSVPFVCATADSAVMLQGRMARFLGPDGMTAAGYVVSFSDVSREVATMATDNAIRRALTRDLRGPLAAVRAAAETIAAYPGMTPRERAAFDEVVFDECAVLTGHIERLEARFREQSDARWLMADIHSLDLFNCLARACGGRNGVLLTMVGIPLWLHGDSHSLLLAFQAMIGRIAAATGARSLDIEALLGDRRVYIELSWRGAPIASAEMDSWMDTPLEGALGRQTLRDVLDRHGAEQWSQPLKDGVAALRVPLPAPFRPQFIAGDETPARPPRPEFYDFALMRAHSHTGALGPRPLAELTYVVFDTETTGLRPTEGDRIVSVGAVRVVNRRILTGETFERLVHPERPIPEDSIRFHGITDAMVEGKPPIAVVLPQLASFIGEAVLVAHNAAFDLKFLEMQEEPTGIAVRNPVVDTLLLAALLDPDGDHSLDGVARRLGVPAGRRHTALSDALVTAEVLIRLLDLAEAQGLHTFEDLMRACDMAAEVRIRGLQF